MTPIECIAVLFGLLCVWLTIRQNIWCWPTGLVQVILFIYIFYSAKLYSDVGLHVIYVGLQIYGWYFWLHGKDHAEQVPVSRMSKPNIVLWAMGSITATLVLGYLMASKTDAAIPYGDAFTTITSLSAQWLMARKRLQSWIFWMVVDVVAVGIYFTKELYLTSGLYAVFFVMAIVGYFAWSRTVTGIEAFPK